MADAILTVQVTPRSRRDEVRGWQDGVLRVSLKAPPVEGRANEALCRYLAACLGLPPSAVVLVSGATARLKRVRVTGRTEEEIKRLLEGASTR